MSFFTAFVILLVIGAVGWGVWRMRSAPAPVQRARAGVGQKLRWLAIRTETPETVVQTLGIRNPERCPWGEGFARAKVAGSAFVTPPSKGWVLVITGNDLCKAVLSDASAKMGREVQAFVTDSAAGIHGWMLAREGTVERAWKSEQGEILEDEGEPTEDERVLGLVSSPEKVAEKVDQAVLLSLATRWSVNPKALIDRDMAPGWVGEWKP